jgi:hypothetical protein
MRMTTVPIGRTSSFANLGDEPRKQKFRRFAEVMYMLPINLNRFIRGVGKGSLEGPSTEHQVLGTERFAANIGH